MTKMEHKKIKKATVPPSITGRGRKGKK